GPAGLGSTRTQNAGFTLNGSTTDGDTMTLASLSCGPTGQVVNQGPNEIPNYDIRIRFGCNWPNGPLAVTVTAVLSDQDGQRIITLPFQLADDTLPNVAINGLFQTTIAATATS